MQTIDRRGKKFLVIETIGDGNCMFRAVIQSLMVQGILTDKQDWVIEYLKNVKKRNEQEVKKKYGLECPNNYNFLIQQFKKQKLNALDTFSKNLFLERGNTSVLFFLQACLRQDSYKFLLERTSDKLELDKMKTLGESADIQDLALYFKHHKISAQIYIRIGVIRDEVEYTDTGQYTLLPLEDLERENYGEPEIEIHLRCPNDNTHYDVLIPAEQFNLALSAEQEKESKALESKALQIAEDEKESKALQINLLKQNCESVLPFLLEFKLVDKQDVTTLDKLEELLNDQTRLKSFLDILENSINEKGYTDEFLDHAGKEIKAFISDNYTNEFILSTSNFFQSSQNNEKRCAEENNNWLRRRKA